MPVYEFKCGNGHKEEILLPMDKRNDAQICPVCSSPLERVLSIPLPAVFKRTGRGMALDSLNSGNTVPNRWYKGKAEKLAAAGLERPPKRVW